MARRARLYFPKTAQHILLLTRHNEQCFVDEDDFECYLNFLETYLQKFAVALHAYILLPDRIHLLLTPTSETQLAKFIQTMGRQYVRQFNQKYQRGGSLWQARYRSTLVQNQDYVLQVSRYIELSPLRQQLVDRASSYRWSSYGHNALGRAQNFLTEHSEYRKLAKSAAQRAEKYRQLCRKRLTSNKLAEIADATHKGWVLGSDDFKRLIAEKTGQAVERSARGGDRRSMAYLQHLLAQDERS